MFAISFSMCCYPREINSSYRHCVVYAGLGNEPGRSFSLYQGHILVSVGLYNANPVPGITCNQAQAHFSQTFERSSKGITTLARLNLVNIHNSSF
jgi:hypothetical protein